MTEPMKDKVEHVRRATQSRKHFCHWPGCTVLVPPALWGCRKHWFMLPLALRTKIWAAYRVGQEEDLDVSRDYVAAATEAREWIKRNYAEGGDGKQAGGAGPGAG